MKRTGLFHLMFLFWLFWTECQRLAELSNLCLKSVLPALLADSVTPSI